MTGTSFSSNNHLVAVYGSASIRPGSDDWQVAYQVGRALGAAGCRVISGGYGGVMEAASQGAAEAGAHVIGVTVGLFAQRGITPNRWLTETVACETLRERLVYLVEQPDAFVALRGGIGTLSEIALAWSLLQVGELPARPFVLVGPMWRQVIEVFAAQATVEPYEMRRVTLVERAEDVVPALQAWWQSPPDLPVRRGDERPR